MCPCSNLVPYTRYMLAISNMCLDTTTQTSTVNISNSLIPLTFQVSMRLHLFLELQVLLKSHVVVEEFSFLSFRNEDPLSYWLLFGGHCQLIETALRSQSCELHTTRSLLLQSQQENLLFSLLKQTLIYHNAITGSYAISLTYPIDQKQVTNCNCIQGEEITQGPLTQSVILCKLHLPQYVLALYQKREYISVWSYYILTINWTIGYRDMNK